MVPEYLYADNFTPLGTAGTTDPSGDFNWNELVNDVVNGVNSIIQTNKTPSGQLAPYQQLQLQTGQQQLAMTQAQSNNGLLLLGLVVVVVVLLVRE